MPPNGDRLDTWKFLFEYCTTWGRFNHGDQGLCLNMESFCISKCSKKFQQENKTKGGYDHPLVRVQLVHPYQAIKGAKKYPRRSSPWARKRLWTLLCSGYDVLEVCTCSVGPYSEMRRQRSKENEVVSRLLWLCTCSLGQKLRTEESAFRVVSSTKEMRPCNGWNGPQSFRNFGRLGLGPTKIESSDSMR